MRGSLQAEDVSLVVVEYVAAWRKLRRIDPIALLGTSIVLEYVYRVIAQVVLNLYLVMTVYHPVVSHICLTHSSTTVAPAGKQVRWMVLRIGGDLPCVLI